ncbi:hypothetical protein ABDK00_006720 [Niabella insulamsoli]|uniref:hypothetical protein n=1 Tax=Niabella insulamsoli TaxID=3144874 RepID=UPI0031FCE24C
MKEITEHLNTASFKSLGLKGYALAVDKSPFDANKWYASLMLNFETGTSLQQQFNAESYEGLMIKVQEFFNGLK